MEQGDRQGAVFAMGWLGAFPERQLGFGVDDDGIAAAAEENRLPRRRTDTAGQNTQARRGIGFGEWFFVEAITDGGLQIVLTNLRGDGGTVKRDVVSGEDIFGE